MVIMSQVSNKKQDNKPQKGDKYQGNKPFVEAAVAHCSNNGDLDPSEWMATKQVSKIDRDGKLVVVDDQQVILEVLYEFKEKMAMAKYDINYKSRQAEWEEFKSRKTTFR